MDEPYRVRRSVSARYMQILRAPDEPALDIRPEVAARQTCRPHTSQAADGTRSPPVAHSTTAQRRFSADALNPLLPRVSSLCWARQPPSTRSSGRIERAAGTVNTDRRDHAPPRRRAAASPQRSRAPRPAADARCCSARIRVAARRRPEDLRVGFCRSATCPKSRDGRSATDLSLASH